MQRPVHAHVPAVGGFALLLAVVAAGLLFGPGCGPIVVLPTPCADDSGCPAGLVCDNGSCVSPGCASDADCLGTEHCDPVTMQCAEDCTDDSCPAGQVCSEKSGLCEIHCSDPLAVCPAGTVCEPQSGQCTCAPCSPQPDSCPEGSVCDPVTGDCVDPPCVSDSDCPGGVSLQQCVGGECIDRCDTGDCPEGMICVAPPRGTCTDEGVLDSCVVDEDCETRFFCDAGLCRPRCTFEGCYLATACDEQIGCIPIFCGRDEDCPDPVSQGCDFTTKVCAPRCGPGGECDAGTLCNPLGFCQVQFCQVDADCPASSRCDPDQFVCLAECAITGCAAGEVCNFETGFCEPEPVFADNLSVDVSFDDGTGGESAVLQVGTISELVISFDIFAGGLQARRLDITLPPGLSFTGFVGPGRPAGSAVGTVSGDFGPLGVVQMPPLVAIDFDTAYSDLDGDGIYTVGADLVCRHETGVAGARLAVTAPRGGDLTALEHTLPFDGSIEMRIAPEIIDPISPGSYALSADLTSVDPGTGGPADGFYPEPSRTTVVTSLDVAPAAAPPPVPDGNIIPGTPLTVSLNANGVDLDVAWDVVTCTATDYVLVMGDLANVATLTIDSAACALGTGGTATVTPSSDSVFFMMSSVDATGVESSHGFDGTGADRTSSGITFCGITSQSLSGDCP